MLLIGTDCLLSNIPVAVTEPLPSACSQTPNLDNHYGLFVSVVSSAGDGKASKVFGLKGLH